MAGRILSPMLLPTRAEIESSRTRHVGKRIRFLGHIEPDPQPLSVALMGTCRGVDDAGQILVNWDNGRTLSLTPDGDKWEVVD